VATDGQPAPDRSDRACRRRVWDRAPRGLIWDVDPARPKEPRLLAFHIGLVAWETVVVVRRGANYGWPLREGTQVRTLEGMGPIPADDSIPIPISDTRTRGSVKPTYPILQYPHRSGGGDAIANGFIYRGKQIPALKDKLDSGTSRPAGSGTPIARHCSPPTMAIRSPWRRFMRSRPACGSWSRESIGHAVAKMEIRPERPRSPDAVAWICGSRG
jgi:hypothetical protein